MKRSFRGEARSPVPPEMSPNFKPPEQKVAVDETEVRERLLSQMLDKLVVIDVGKPGKNRAEPLSELETWQLLTNDSTISEEEFTQILAEENRVDLTSEQLVALHYMWIGQHGKVVTSGLEIGMVGVADAEVDQEIPFQSFAESQDSAKNMISVQQEGLWYSDSGKSRGPRMVLSIKPPQVQLEKGKIGSGSFQFGKVVIDLRGEKREIQNKIYNHGAIKSFVTNYGDLPSEYNRLPVTDQQFIFPVGKTFQDIDHIQIDYLQEGQIIESTTIHPKDVSEDAEMENSISITRADYPIERYTIYFNSGEVVTGKEDPTNDDYDFTWEKDENAPWTLPNQILGAYNPENPHRDENLTQLKIFLQEHPDNFWVLAIGNHGDVLTDEDMQQLPQNFIAVGQYQSQEWQGETYINTTFGHTVGNRQTIFSTKEEFGVDVDGSSLITPQVAAAIGLYAIENGSTDLSRDKILEHFSEQGITEVRELQKPPQPGEQSEFWQGSYLKADSFKNWFSKDVDNVLARVNSGN